MPLHGVHLLLCRPATGSQDPASLQPWVYSPCIAMEADSVCCLKLSWLLIFLTTNDPLSCSIEPLGPMLGSMPMYHTYKCCTCGRLDPPVIAVCQDYQLVLEWKAEKSLILKPMLFDDFFFDTMIGHCKIEHVSFVHPQYLTEGLLHRLTIKEPSSDACVQYRRCSLPVRERQINYMHLGNPSGSDFWKRRTKLAADAAEVRVLVYLGIRRPVRRRHHLAKLVGCRKGFCSKLK